MSIKNSKWAHRAVQLESYGAALVLLGGSGGTHGRHSRMSHAMRHTCR